jgi:hypothetical protein
MDVLDAILALVPDPDELFASVFERADDHTWYEVHFSLCVLLEVYFVDDQISATREFDAAIPGILQRYLMSVKHEHAKAAWNAGDSFSFDARGPTTITPHLLDAAKGARYVAGRLGALHGICHLLASLEERAGDTEIVLRAMRSVAREDRSPRVRRKARMIIAGYRCILTPSSYYDRLLDKARSRGR